MARKIVCDFCGKDLLHGSPTIEVPLPGMEGRHSVVIDVRRVEGLISPHVDICIVCLIDLLVREQWLDILASEKSNG